MRTSIQLKQGMSGLQRALTSQPSKPLTSFSRSLYSQSATSSLSRQQPLPLRSPVPVRYNSSRPAKPLTESKPLSESEKAELKKRRENEPAYQITFTCKPCGARSAHRITKHGYHKGTIVINCPGCNNRHVISDHLKIFMDEKRTLEDILKEKGQSLTRGTLEGDMEFWEDGTVTPREKESKESASPASLGSGEQKPSS